MGEEIKNLLEKEIKNQIENLASLEPGSEKHSTAVESLAKLYKVKLDEDKTSMEYLDKTQNRESDEGFKIAQIEENVKDRYVKIGIAAAELVLPLMFYAFWMRKGFKFEEKGTYTSTTSEVCLAVLNQPRSKMVPKRGVRGYHTASSFFSVKIASTIMRDVKVLFIS